MTKIEQLESELNNSLNSQYLLHETLKNNTKTLRYIEKQLREIEANLKCSNEYIYALEQENRKLKLSGHEWMEKAVKLKLEVLSTRIMIKNSP